MRRGRLVRTVAREGVGERALLHSERAPGIVALWWLPGMPRESRVRTCPFASMCG